MTGEWSQVREECSSEAGELWVEADKEREADSHGCQKGITIILGDVLNGNEQAK